MIYQVIFILLFDIYKTNALFGRNVTAKISPSFFIKTPGSVVEVNCQLTTTRYSVNDLQLIKFKGDETTVLNSTIVDNTTIRASFGPVDMTDNQSKLYCRSNNSTLARKRLVVDVPPTAPTKMDCINYHLISMECKFTPNVRRNLITDWIIQYTNSGLGGIFTTCQTQFSNPAECILGGSQDNLANPFYPMLNHTFKINVTNYLGTEIAFFQVDPWKVVKPDPVRDLHAEVLNSTCIKVTWSYTSFPPAQFPLQYHVTVNSYVQETRKVATNLDRQILCDLPPNTEVKVTVHCKAAFGGYPSDNLTVTAQLPEDKPRSPFVPTGAFSTREISNTTREITLYWQEIPSRFKHGDITQHKASVFNDTSLLPIFTQAIAPNSVTAVISPDLRNDANYRILIQAKTTKGYSDIVETAMANVSEVQRVTNRPVWVDSELIGQGVYTAYWSAETDHPSITRVYWCYGQSTSDGQVMCYTSIQMEPSVTNSSEHTVQVNEGSLKKPCDTCKWNLGVSMETNGTFSGIIWNGCRYRRHREPRLDDVVLSNVTVSSVTVTWQHSCWLVTQFGRPEYYELGVLDSDTDDNRRCNEIKVTQVQAKHGEMVKTIKSRPKTSLCIRAVGRDNAGAWLIRPIILHGVNHGLSTEVVAGLSVCLVLFGFVLMLLIVRLCVRKKWFDKIYIEVPRATKSHLLEDDVFKPSLVKMKDNPLYARNDLKASGSSATKETVVSCSTPSPKIRELMDHCNDFKTCLVFFEDSYEKDQSVKACKDSTTGHQCSTISTVATLEYPGSKNIAEGENQTHESENAQKLQDNSHEYESVASSGSEEYTNRKHSINGSMAAFSGSFDEVGSDVEGSLSYVQAGCDEATLKENEALLKKGEGRPEGDNSRKPESEAHLKSSKFSEPSIDGSNYLLLKHTTNPYTGCNYYHHEEKNIISGKGLLESNAGLFNDDNNCRKKRHCKSKHKKNVRCSCNAEGALGDALINGNIV